MRLLLVELDRFRSRRAVALMLLAGVALVALLVVTAAWDTRPPSAAEQAAARSQAATAAADPRLQREQQQCAESPRDFFGPDATVADCAGLEPRVSDFLPRNSLDLSRVVDHRGEVAAVLVTALLVMCGATFAGGDWATGSIANQLLFRPRRAQVWLAKAGAVALASALAAGVLLGGFWVSLLSLAAVRDLAVPDAVLSDVLWSALRGVALGAGGAVGGYALAMLLRSTVATLGVLFAFAVVGEALVTTLPLDRASRWSLPNNVFAWLEAGTRVFDTDVTCRVPRAGCEQSYLLGTGHGAAYLGVLLALAVGLSLLTFRSRDVA